MKVISLNHSIYLFQVYTTWSPNDEYMYWLKDKQKLHCFIIDQSPDTSFFHRKVQWVVLAILQVKSQSGSCNEIWILRPFSKAAEKTRSCFALDTEHQYCTVTVQYLCSGRAQPDWTYEFPDQTRPDTQICNVLPLHFVPSQASSSQNSNVDSYLQY